MKKPDIKKMTLREKIAQTLVVRQSDLLMYADSAYSKLRDPKDAFELMKEYQFGGMWTHGNEDVNQMGSDLYAQFKFNSDSYLEWLTEVEKVCKIPLICANDARGIRAFSDLSPVVSGLIVGAANDEKLAFELGRQVALEHSCYGCNWLWTPVTDLVNRFASNIVRLFSSDRDTLTCLADAYIKGIQSVGVAATAKHFPGADPTEKRDGHIVTTYVRTSFEEWKKNQAVVFKTLIDNGVYTIMSATRAFPAVDDTKINGKYLPATLSHKIVTGLLKEEMGFEGVVITDDVSMGGYTSFYSHDELYVQFLKAGNDMLLGVGIDAVDIIERGVLRGDLSEDRIDDACRRILELKEKLGMFEDSYQRGKVKIEDVKEDTVNVLRKIAEKGITLVRDEEKLLPISGEKVKNVKIICHTHDENVFANLNVMKAAFEKRGAQVTMQRRLSSWKEAEQIAKENDLIVYVGYIYFHAPKGAPSFYGEEQWAFRYAFTSGKEKSIGISLGYPFIHYDFMDECPTFVNGYNATPETQEAFVAAIYGEIPFCGKSPVDLSVE